MAELNRGLEVALPLDLTVTLTLARGLMNPDSLALPLHYRCTTHRPTLALPIALHIIHLNCVPSSGKVVGQNSVTARLGVAFGLGLVSSFALGLG